MLVAGLMSGTSVDGIDVALVEITGEGRGMRVEPTAFQELPYPAGVREAILAVSNAETHTSRISQLNFLLGRLYGEAIVEACRLSGVPIADLDLVGSHGQTIYHQPTGSRLAGHVVRGTMQIGEPALIAEITGVPVIADFRPADMAAGGQGAPLVPYVDYLLYRDAERGRVALNIGGIANLTAIGPGAGPDEVIAFDTGPGNMIIDGLVEEFTNGAERFDRDGERAASGRVAEALLGRLTALPYFDEPPPKSAGREQFGGAFVADLAAQGIEPHDLIATVTAFSAETIAAGIRKWVAPKMPVDQMIASGGGTHNPEIMRRLRELLPDTEIIPASALGPAADAKEAAAFAILAHETFHRRAANLPSATGAARACILGKLSWPPPKT